MPMQQEKMSGVLENSTINSLNASTASILVTTSLWYLHNGDALGEQQVREVALDSARVIDLGQWILSTPTPVVSG
jgi:hypothetical protein